MRHQSPLRSRLCSSVQRRRPSGPRILRPSSGLFNTQAETLPGRPVRRDRIPLAHARPGLRRDIFCRDDPWTSALPRLRQLKAPRCYQQPGQRPTERTLPMDPRLHPTPRPSTSLEQGIADAATSAETAGRLLRMADRSSGLVRIEAIARARSHALEVLRLTGGVP